MTQKPRRQFTTEQKAEAVRIVEQSGKPIAQIATEMGLTESALRNWASAVSSAERLNKLKLTRQKPRMAL